MTYLRPPLLTKRLSATKAPLCLAGAVSALLRGFISPLWVRVVRLSTRPQPLKFATSVSTRCRPGLPVPSPPTRIFWCRICTRRRRAARASASRAPRPLVVPLLAAVRLAMGLLVSCRPPRRCRRPLGEPKNSLPNTLAALPLLARPRQRRHLERKGKECKCFSSRALCCATSCSC